MGQQRVTERCGGDLEHLDVETCIASLFCSILFTINDAILDGQTLTLLWTPTGSETMTSPPRSPSDMKDKHHVLGTNTDYSYIYIERDLDFDL